MNSGGRIEEMDFMSSCIISMDAEKIFMSTCSSLSFVLIEDRYVDRMDDTKS